LKHFLTHGFLANAFDELFDDFEMNVGLKQSDTNLAQGGFHVLGGEFAFPAHVFEHALEFVRKIIKHSVLLLSWVWLEASRDTLPVVCQFYQYSEEIQRMLEHLGSAGYDGGTCPKMGLGSVAIYWCELGWRRSEVRTTGIASGWGLMEVDW
jgi:hypothetical protein